MKKWTDELIWVLKILVGSALFALGFDLFLAPNNLNAGGISGLSMVVIHMIGIGSVGVVNALINLPLFIFGGIKIGRRFFFGSLIGMLSSSLLIDLLAPLQAPATEPLLNAVYGGAIVGAGLGLVFAAGGSTGGSDIVVRLLKLRWRNVPIGQISMAFDTVVAVLTGIVFRDFTRALYTGAAIFVTSYVMDAVVYSFDYSKVALIISPEHEKIAQEIGRRLDRGATYLKGQGSYTHNDTMVVLTAVKKQQVAELKELVTQIDPNAFIIVQEAHQVLGDGFTHYSKDSL